MSHRTSRQGFSLIELVIVVVIIGIIAAIAIPRLSRGATGAGDSALSGDLSVMRSAIDLYAAEHNGSYPSVASFSAQMCQYSDGSGTTAAAKTSTIIYGPYMRSVPTLPVGPATAKGSSTVVDGSTGVQTGIGAWFYNASTGSVTANTATGTGDTSGKDYNTY